MIDVDLSLGQDTHVRKALSGLLILVLSIPLSSLAAVSAPKAGNACPKNGATQSYKGLKFTCIKSGKKLLWDKGVKVNSSSATAKPVPTPFPSPTSSPAATPEPSFSPTPRPLPSSSTSTFVEPLAPTSFQDLEFRKEGINYWAWKKANQKIKNTSPNLGTIKISTGPNTVPDNPNPMIAITLVSRLFGNFNQAREVRVVYASEKDIEWGQSQINSLCPEYECGYDVKGEAKKACNIPVTPCWGGLAVRNAKLEIPMIYMTASDWGKSDANHTQGTLEAHEYAHTIQQLNAVLGKSNGWYTIPRWLVEGGATWIQSSSVFYDNYISYLTERNRNIQDLKSRIHPNSEWIVTFLNPEPVKDWLFWEKYENWRLYDVGLLATEILASIGGPDAIMDIFKGVGEGNTFTDVFEKVFGITWKQAVPILARIIEAETN